ncbi:hypothetical protein [Serratia liquefaciens]|uniref:hypothetical protein n=1 Tax=Serratia liquefaciens TaxID=614 RepID=UPI0021C9CAAC|nr:hypothetical protein [Serratia liquefaciens]
MVAEVAAVATKSGFCPRFVGLFPGIKSGARDNMAYLKTLKDFTMQKTMLILVLGAIVLAIAFNPEFIAGFWDGLPMK